MGLRGKNVVLGVTGGIAVYKSVELLRLLQKEGATVRVILTENGAKFVGPLTFEALTHQPVCMDLFHGKGNAYIQHIEWAENADLVVVAPATANIIAKMAGGIADDALSTFLLAVTAPTIVCPAMNTHMYENTVTQRNIRVLREDGKIVIDPADGDLACGTTGAGRFPDPPDILDRILAAVSPKDFSGKKILVTAGPTREYLDPVRFISNPSTGKMGYAIARAAEHRGASVTLVAGPIALPDPPGVSVVKVTSAQEMAEAVFDRMMDAHAIVKSAAVSDYRPVETALHKVKKTDGPVAISMTRTPDILLELGRRKKAQVLVGFAAETRDLAQNAQAKLAAKNLDMIVGNLVGGATGFGTDTNKVTFFFRDGSREELDEMDKMSVAHRLLDRISGLLTS